MGNIDPTTGMAVFIVLATLVHIVSTIIRTVIATRRTPPLGEDQAKIKADLEALTKAVESKQDATLCTAHQQSLARTLEDIQTRHRAHESKLSKQVGGIHDRINVQTSAIAENGAKLETFMTEIRSWRNSKNA